MIIQVEVAVGTDDDIVHEVTLDGKRIGFVIKTECRDSPFAIVDIDGPTGNAGTLQEAVMKMACVHASKSLPEAQRMKFMASLAEKNLRGELSDEALILKGELH